MKVWKYPLVVAFASFAWAGTAQAATMTVGASAPDVVAVNGVCSLREAISAANTNSANADCPASGTFGNDIINLPAGTYTTAIATTCDDTNANGDYDIIVVPPGETLTISGAGADTTAIDGGDIDRVFDLIQQTSSPAVTFNDVTIRNGTARLCTGSGFDNGGGIRIPFSATATLNDSVVSGNDAVNGGGIRNGGGTLFVNRSTISGNNANQAGGGEGGGLSNSGGTSTLINSTVSGNTAATNGGGIASGGGTRVRNVTITANTAGDDGGGLFHTSDSGSITIRNTIIAENTDTAGGNTPDCGQQFPGGAGTLNSEGFNLIGNNDGCTFFITATGDQIGTPATPIDPQLGALVDNGGTTPTHVLLPGSPAIDLANTAGCFSNDANNGSLLTVDQRSFERPLDGDGDANVRCDVGAIEVGCGNGFVELPEECDDANAADGDGCSTLCELESCGDGVVQPSEGCDDGNTVSNDGCSAGCVPELCGDGILQTNEACDDGNTTNGDGCSSACVVENPLLLLLGDGGCSLIRDGMSRARR